MGAPTSLGMIPEENSPASQANQRAQNNEGSGRRSQTNQSAQNEEGLERPLGRFPVEDSFSEAVSAFAWPTKRPDSKSNIGDVPSMYFFQLTLMVAVIWVLTIVRIGFYDCSCPS